MRRMNRNGHAQVLRVIRQVRRRWRLRVALRGLAVVLGLGFVAFAASALGMDFFRFTPRAVTGFRVLAYVALVALAVWFLVRPLLRRVTDQQVALYLEEHEPTLEAALLSALELGDGGNAGHPSPELLGRMVQQAVDRCRAVEYGRRVEAHGLQRSTGVLAGLVALVALVVAFGPAPLRNGVSALLFPVRDAAAVNPYSIIVLPGDTTVARNSDQAVLAELHGFESPDVALVTRSTADNTFRRLSMLPADSGRFEILLLDVADETEYYVESSGVRSETFTIEVADLPYVDELKLVYHFPAYTGLEPRTVENGGDIAALAGTRVELHAKPTISTPAGVLWVDEASQELERQEDGSFAGQIVVRQDGYYRIELAGPNGDPVPASPQYTIDVLTDQPPAISFNTPGRDIQASPIDEVLVEARADDDFGVGSLDLIYSVNGEPEDTVNLYRKSGAGLAEVVATHTFFLEEWELEPGDVISYYATVRDNNGGNGEVITSDLYFIQARPFGRDYRQADQAGGPPQGGGGAALEGALSELQRQVIAATFNLIRDRESYDEESFRENLVSVGLAQGRLREQVETLARRMANRGIFETDPRMRDIGEALPLAAEAMKEAEDRLEEQAPKEALGPEQRALQLVLKAEETFERTVGEGQQGGGGGGGAQAEELADLFELELDKLKNQYETVQRGQQQQQDNQLDETLERLKELARRQQQEAERQRRRAAAGQQGGGGGGDSQRALADETEEAARQLERLARETQSQDLMDASRRLQEAADAMRRSAGSQGNASTAEATSALDRLEDAQRRLEEQRDARLRRDVADARQRAEELAREQERMREDVADLQRGGFGGVQQLERLMERKDAMFEEVADLERQLDRAAAEALREDQREAAGKIQEAAGGIRDDKLKEKIRFSKGVAQERDATYADAFEEQIARDIERLGQRLEDAEGAIGSGPRDRMAEALDRTRELVRGMESMEERLRQGAGQQGEERGQAGQDGQQPDGQPGEGQQGQGQPGEGQQGERQQGEGQQGGEQAGGQRHLEGSDQAGGRQGRGGQQAQGQPTGDPSGGQPDQTGGRPDGGGPPPPGGGFGGDRRAELSPDQVRQFRREAGRREQEARELRNLLQEEGREVQDLDDVIDSLEALQRTRVYGDPVELARLQDEVIEGLRRFEFALRRELTVDGDRVFLGGSDEVPPAYRDLVEEYYRALSRDPGR